MPEPVEVTDEMRRAVYEADCVQMGHIPNFGNLFITEGSDGYIPPGVPEDVMPHITCMRCGKVWLLIEEPGVSYEEAESKLTSNLKANNPIINRIKDKQTKRETRRALEKARRETARAEAEARLAEAEKFRENRENNDA